MRGDGQFNKVPTVRFERRPPGPIERVGEFIADASRPPNLFGEGAIAAANAPADLAVAHQGAPAFPDMALAEKVAKAKTRLTGR